MRRRRPSGFSTPMGNSGVGFLGAGAAPVNAAALLATAILWYDCPNYSGSGPLINSGTLGTGFNAALGASAPTFASGAFTFNGTSNYMSIPASTSYRILAGDDFAIGMVITQTAAQNNGEFFSFFSGLRLRSAGAALTVQALIGDGFAATETINGPGHSSGVRSLVACVRNIAGNSDTVYTNNVAGGSSAVIDNNNLSQSGNGGYIGALETGTLQWQSFTMRAAFLFRKKLSTAELRAIADYYGCP